MLLRVARAAAIAVRRGHPWVYRDGLVRPPKGLASGTAVELGDDAGQFLGHGLWDAESPIALRVFERERGKRLDERALGERLERAIARRDAMFGADLETTAYRLCNGEGDRLPGLVLDRYGDVAVLRLDGDALRPWLDRLIPTLAAALGKRRIHTVGLRAERDDRSPTRLATLHGPNRMVWET